MVRGYGVAIAVAVGCGLLAGCAESAPRVSPGTPSASSSEPATGTTPAAPSAVPSAGTAADPAPAGPRTGDGTPRRASLSIPDLGIVDLPVVPYRGRTDDAPGTAIQDRGVAASPFGPAGGTGPGGVGNYQVTAHRLSSTRAFEFLPDLRAGDRVVVETDRWRYVYEIRTTRQTSFRSARSLREQRAAVPGRVGREPTRAMITLSICATVEDHAAGNYWADEFDNPEHRIDKIGILVATRRVAG